MILFWRRSMVMLLMLVTCGLTFTWATSPPSTAQRAEPGPAHRSTVVTGAASDPDDTLGRLDISGVSDRTVETAPEHFQVSYRVNTFASFASSRLDPHDRNFVLELNRDSQAGSERNVRISSRHGALVAEVISNATREVLTTVTVGRPNDHAIQISGPRRLLGARSYFWASNFHAPKSPSCSEHDGFQVVCQDDVPNDGWLRLEAPAWPDLR